MIDKHFGLTSNIGTGGGSTPPPASDPDFYRVALNFAGQVDCSTSNAWITATSNFTMAHHGWTESKGTGASPTGGGEDKGIGIAPTGTILRSLILHGEIGTVGLVDNMDVAIGILSLDPSTSDTITNSTPINIVSQSEDIFVFSAGSMQNVRSATLGLGDYVMPFADTIRIYFRAKGTISSIGKYYMTGTLYMDVPA